MRGLAVFLLCAALCALPALAVEEDGLFGAEELEEAVPEEAREILGEADIGDALEPEGLLTRLWEGALDALGSVWREAAAGAVKLTALCLLISAASALAGEAAREYMNMAGCLAVAAVAFGEAGEWISAGAAAVAELHEFSRALLPCLTAAAAAGGMVTGAAARYAATSLFMDILISLTRTLLLPLAYALLAVRTAGAALGNEALNSAAKLIKWLCFGLTAGLMTVFTLYLNLSGAVTGAADAAAARAAKTAISAALPVVGGIISDAAGALTAGASLLKGAVGALGAAVVAAVCLVPFLSLGLRYLFYKAAAALASCFAEKRLAELIGEVGSVFALVLGVTGAAAAMLFVAILSAVKAVGG